MHDPLILDDRKLLVDHHARLAAVEVETREARADVGELRAAIAEVGAGVGDLKTALANIAGTVAPLVTAATAAHQQTATLLTYLFSSCLAIAGGSLSAWLTGQAHLPSGGQIGISAAAALVCVLVARLAIAHSHH